MGAIRYRPNHPLADKDGFVDIEIAGPKNPDSASNDPHFYIQSDTMEATRHMADNKMYTSKAKFRAATRAHGCVEVGNDPAILRPRKPIQLSKESRREAIQRSIYELRNR